MTEMVGQPARAKGIIPDGQSKVLSIGRHELWKIPGKISPFFAEVVQ